MQYVFLLGIKTALMANQLTHVPHVWNA